MNTVMKNITEIFVLAARNKDTDSWINIFFVIILVVFWAIGGIIKGKAKKAKEMEDKSISRGPQKPRGYRPKGLQERLEKALGQLVPTSMAESPQRKPFSQQQKQPHRDITQIRPIIQKEPSSTKQPAKGKLPEPLPLVETLQPEQVKTEFSDTFSKTEIKQLFAPTLDLSDPDELKKAILHYEILGKPLSLRGQGEHIIGL